MITIIAYRPAWPIEFEALGTAVRDVLGSLALRIDHIGSTSVPGLAAKDIIDIQVTVAQLEVPVELALNRAGYMRLKHIEQDHIPPGSIGEGRGMEKVDLQCGYGPSPGQTPCPRRRPRQ